MQNKSSCTRGFTLIELLVVVLIIGILASIALVQYQKAVEESRMAEAVTTLGSIGKAVDVAWLSGETPTKDSLDVSFSSWDNKNFSYDYWGGHVVAACRRNTTATCVAAKVRVVKVLREIGGLNLSSAKGCVDGSHPCPDTPNLTKPVSSASYTSTDFDYIVFSFRGKIFATCDAKHQYICDAINE